MLSIEYWRILLLLPLPLIVWWLVPESVLCRQSALKIPFYSRLSNIAAGYSASHSSSPLKILLAVLIWGLLVVASANPVWLGKPVAITRSGRALMLAVDLSQSMESSDMQWQRGYARRIDVVKAVAEKFISERQGDRLGLILFGSNAYLQAPLTFDRKTVGEMLDDATLGLAGPRTAIGDAVGLAVKRMEKYADKDKVLILLTDGADNSSHVDSLEIAQLAAKKHIRIYTIGLGALRSSYSRDLDEKLLQKMAQITGGLYFRASNTYDLQDVYQQLNQLEPVKADKTFLRPKTPLYPWFLAVVFFLLVIGLLPMRFVKKNT